MLPLKDQAIQKAEKFARETVQKVADVVAKCNDLQIIAPYPFKIDVWSSEYNPAKQKYNFYSSLTESIEKNSSRGMHDPMLVKMSEAKVERFVQMAKENAAAQYDLFVAKLTNKIGETNSATLEGNHVWGYSFLTVETVSGEKQVWKTQQIVNVSKLGTIFNQWPTRKVKI